MRVQIESLDKDGAGVIITPENRGTVSDYPPAQREQRQRKARKPNLLKCQSKASADSPSSHVRLCYVTLCQSRFDKRARWKHRALCFCLNRFRAKRPTMAPPRSRYARSRSAPRHQAVPGESHRPPLPAEFYRQPYRLKLLKCPNDTPDQARPGCILARRYPSRRAYFVQAIIEGSDSTASRTATLCQRPQQVKRE